MHGWAAYRVHTKLKILKPEIKQWSKVTYGKMDATINSSKQDIEELEAKAEESVLDEQEIVKIKAPTKVQAFGWQIVMGQVTNKTKYEEKRNYGGYWMCFLWKVWKKISSFPVKWRIWFGMISFCGYKCLSLGVVCM
ncbi:hypothetical protein RIF29_35597 [Crotalaria pallida]|uniref:Uncharacterized protein n=1 Tax=Crotalaria pallida TaxID=3830 RepID=A0AAN9HU42_CROPI